ncbi:hypothetical protein HMPREF9533_00599 [Escherichia coli MS 60-1]|nr:hypothetical protein HMPREF9553_00737 [Escherichia coli MS 200-1]EGB84514.1 hypothetical protein HMPREF9533_00599 [Escherichia coli MS 60-1]ESE31664.1 hypothetical protein HMPREF1622_03654 [Escherichia coli A35218R]
MKGIEKYNIYDCHYYDFFIACSINVFLDLLVNGEVLFLIPLFFLN